MIRVGIVGLPNVGKSSLFNALTAGGAPSANYPFCTVEPNVGDVAVPDPRLDAVHALAPSTLRVPTMLRFVDIAGLVRGASTGEGLGNQFLANIREVDAIAHVLRCFEDPDVAHVVGGVDPLRDREIVDTELALADLELVERRLEKVEKKARAGEKDAQKEVAALRRALEPLAAGQPVRAAGLSGEEVAGLRPYQLLTLKPVLYVTNVGEADLAQGGGRWTDVLAEALAREGGEPPVPVCSTIEAELAELEDDERREFLAELGTDEGGLDRFVRGAYHVLGLVTFFTTGDKETRAWTVPRGTHAPQAAGTIHTDFERGFIRAETIAWDDYVEAGSFKQAREEGMVRSEGKDYVVEDGDLMLFRFNV